MPEGSHAEPWALKVLKMLKAIIVVGMSILGAGVGRMITFPAVCRPAR